MRIFYRIGDIILTVTERRAGGFAKSRTEREFCLPDLPSLSTSSRKGRSIHDLDNREIRMASVSNICLMMGLETGRNPKLVLSYLICFNQVDVSSGNIFGENITFLIYDSDGLEQSLKLPKSLVIARSVNTRRLIECSEKTDILANELTGHWLSDGSPPTGITVNIELSLLGSGVLSQRSRLFF